jgi:putative ABC transport system permease protein
LLARVLDPVNRDYILGDLAEEYHRRAEAGKGPRRWYWRQLRASVVPSLRSRLRRRRGIASRVRYGAGGRGGPGLVGDLFFSIRSLRSRPGIAVPWIATLALGIGGTTAIFTVVDSVLLRPLPFPDAGRLVALCERHPSVAGYCIASPANVEDWSRRASSFEAMGLGRTWPFAVNWDGGRGNVSGGLATPGLFEVFAVEADLGRTFVDSDLTAGAHRTAILSHDIWVRHFGSDPSAIGRGLNLEGEGIHTVIGVLPKSLRLPGLEDVDIWTPLPFEPTEEEHRSWRGFMTFGRLAPTAELAVAAEQMATVSHDLALIHPEANEGWTVEIVPLLDQVVGPVRRALWVFMGAVSILMLIACANVANLALVRGQRRTRELAIRASLGARRGGLVRLLLAESLVLALLGGGMGLGLAEMAVQAFVVLAPSGVPRLAEVGVDLRVFSFATALSIAAGVLVGLLPALRVTRTDLRISLREGDGRRSGVTLRRGLVVSEVALALVLLVGAGLLVRSFVTLSSYDPGFERDRLVTSWLLIQSERYPQGPDAVGLFSRVQEEVAALPGVAAVGYGSAGPLFGGREVERILAEGTPEPAPGEEPVARYFDVSPGYFPALGLPVVRGRNVRESDATGSPEVVVVNETLVGRLWPEGDPLGRRIRLVDIGRTVEVVGVVADIPPLDPDAPVEAAMYWPARQSPRFATYLVVRTEGDPAHVVPSLEQRVAALEPDLSIGTIRTMDALLGRRLVQPRFDMSLLGVFAGAAMLLALVGVYGVVSQGVIDRNHEIGIRVSLGARSAQVVSLVMREGVGLAMAGLVLGWLIAASATRVLSGMLFGIDSADPLTLVGVGLALGGVAVVAALIPARRASRVDPMRTLRWE